jgi:hypothetical protein
MPATRSMAISESPILAIRASATTGETKGRLGTYGPPGGALRRLMPFRMVRAQLISRSWESTELGKLLNASKWVYNLVPRIKI